MKPLADKRILLVEDEALIADMVVDMLVGLGATVIGPATTLEEGLSLAGTEEFDAAVLDVNLRGKPIDPVADLLDARGIPVVFATGYGKAAGAERRTSHRQALYPGATRRCVGAHHAHAGGRQGLTCRWSAV